MDKHKFPIICKQRQNGISSIVCAKALHTCLCTPNSSCLLMSYSLDSVTAIWDKLRAIYNSIPSDFRLPLKIDNKNEMVFSNGSKIVCATCGTRDTAHGSTFSYVHLSEAAKCRASLTNQIAAIMACLVPDGIFCIESTPQDGITKFAEMFKDAENGEGLWHPVFFSWVDDIGVDGMHHKEQVKYAKKYISTHGKLPTFEELDDEEKELYFKGCGFDILAWRRLSILNLGGKNKFNENFPADSTTAFLSNITDSMFDATKIQEKLLNIRDIESIPMPDDLPDILKPWYKNGLEMWARPELYDEEEQTDGRQSKRDKKEAKRKKYYLGIDTAEGGGRNADYSVIEVMDEDGFQCAELRTNKTKPFMFAELVNELGKYYNDGLLIIEKASAGIACLEKLRDDYEYYNIFRSKDPDSRGAKRKDGFTTTNKTKTILINSFIEWFEKDDVIINSKYLLNEMLVFSFKGGRMAASVGHDDCVISMALCIAGFKSDIYYI